jgi:hypothetical protein
MCCLHLEPHEGKIIVFSICGCSDINLSGYYILFKLQIGTTAARPTLSKKKLQDILDKYANVHAYLF